MSICPRATNSCNKKKMDLLLKHLGKHEIGDYVDETIRKHVGSPHTGGLSPSKGSHQFDEFLNGLHDNLGKMNLDSHSIAQPHTRLPTTGDPQFNLGDQFQPVNVNFPLDYQPPRQTYPPNPVREDVAHQRYQPRVSGCFVFISMPNSIPKRRNYSCLAL